MTVHLYQTTYKKNTNIFCFNLSATLCPFLQVFPVFSLYIYIILVLVTEFITKNIYTTCLLSYSIVFHNVILNVFHSNYLMLIAFHTKKRQLNNKELFGSLIKHHYDGISFFLAVTKLHKWNFSSSKRYDFSNSKLCCSF